VAAGNSGQSGLRHDLVFDKTRLCGSARAITGLMFYLILCLLLIFTAWTGVAKAAVDRLEILERHLVAEGAAFGASGAYEKIRGRAWFALDPHAAANAAIADLVLAPRDVRGLVTFGAEFLMLRPAEPARGNGTVLYEVNNRGNIAILAQLDAAPGGNDPSTAADFGNAFLLQQGFTLLWSAWTWDVIADVQEKRLIFEPPIATLSGNPITGEVAYELLVDRPAKIAEFTGIQGAAYGFAEDGVRDAVLTVRERPEGPRRVIPRADWAFVPAPDGGVPRQLALEGKFEPGHLYELSYRARDPYVVAAGLAGIRDLLAFLRGHSFEGAPAPARTLIFGISQSGRVIQTMLLRGMHVDEAGRPVFDAAFVHVAGAGKGGFDYRFAMPTRHFSVVQDHGYATDYFPFTTTTERDPVTSIEASLLDKARQLAAIPKLFFVNNSTEYWNRSASLIHTDPMGQNDLPPDTRARIYLLAGAQHYSGQQRDRGIYANCVNPMNHYRAMRALLLALDRWVRDGSEPPPSTYPRIADGTLVTVAAYKAAFPRIPGLTLPESNLRPPRLDFGPRFAAQRIADFVPPRPDKPLETLVPRPDADGNDEGGVSLPEILVPVGTRTGFNTRTEEAGFPWATARWDGSFIPFARTDAERRRMGDPRPSLEARYRDRADYEQKVSAAAQRVVALGFLREEEVSNLVAEAGSFYDRVVAHDPADRSCRYLFPK
jgi:Alpha/beta hydrolase domain